MSFSTVTVRANSDDILAAWFNDLRTAGVNIENFLGAGFIAETQFTLANNQSAANVTGIVFDSVTYTSIRIDAEIRRKTTTNEDVWNGRIIMLWRALTSTWDVQWAGDGDDPGVTFTVVTTSTSGQLQYATDNMSGSSYVGKLKYKAITFGV
jgi:hypothetical protein